MAGRDPHRDLLERATTALERQEIALQRQEKAFERQERAMAKMFRRMDQRDARAEEREKRAQARHIQLTRRWERSEKLFVAAISDITAETTRELRKIGERLDDMGDEIRANTRAVLSVLDRLDPPAA